MKCEICKKKIEESKPKFFKPLFGFLFLLLVLTLITMGMIIALKGSEIISISLGERIILINLLFFMALSLFFIPSGSKELNKNYKLPYMKRLSFFSKLTFIPYLLMILYFGFNMISLGKINMISFYYLGSISFTILWSLPLILYIIKCLAKK